MRELYNVIEGILDNDKKILDSTELHLRYELFIQYLGDILWKKTPYTYFLSIGTIVFELNQEMQDETATSMYREVESRLTKYFRHLERVYEKKYDISWRHKSVLGGVIYYLNMKEGSKNNVIEFRIKNLNDNRRIDIVWPKSFIFMSPNINEAILDTDTTITKNAEEYSVVSQLIDNGILYACEKTKARFALACQNEIASFENGHLSFFNDNAKVCSEVVIWYDRAKDFLKKHNIKSISAPQITIVKPQEDVSMFGTLKTRYLRVYQPVKDIIKNTDIEEGRMVDYTVIKNGDLNFRRGECDFVDSRQGLIMENSVIKIETFNKITLQNCNIDLKILNIQGEGVNFKNCKGNLLSIEVYEPSLFDGEFGKELFKIFDDKYEFWCWADKGGQKQELRKTNNIRKTLAFFGNKRYYCPNKSPYRITGSLKDICDVSSFNKFYVLKFYSNNYAVNFTTDIYTAQRQQRIDRFKYETNDHQQIAPEQTKDGFYCVIYSEK